MPVGVRCYTDPARIWSWAAEPAPRRLMLELEGKLTFVWAMGRLARHHGSTYQDSEAAVGRGPDCFADPMSHWLNVAGRTGMPCGPRPWTEAPISGTFPARAAVEVASEQGREAGYRHEFALLRAIRGLLRTPDALPTGVRTSPRYPRITANATALSGRRGRRRR